MKRIVLYIFSLLFLTACLDDKTNYDYRDINDWTESERKYITNFQDEYVLYPEESLTIEPTVRLSMDTLALNVSYEWRLDGVLVGEEKNFTYTADKVGQYGLVLSVIDNETKVAFSRETKITVKSPLSSGWMLLTESASGQSEISMVLGRVYQHVFINDRGYEESRDTVIYDEEIRYNLVPNLGNGPRKLIEYYAYGPEVGVLDIPNEIMVLQESGAVEIDGDRLERIIKTETDFEGGVAPEGLDIQDAVLTWGTKWLLNHDGKIYGALATVVSDLHSGTYSSDPEFNGKLFDEFFPCYKIGGSGYDYYQAIIVIGKDRNMYAIVDDGDAADPYNNDFSIYYQNHNGAFAELQPSGSIDMSWFQNIEGTYIYKDHLKADYYASPYFGVILRNGQYYWHEFDIEIPSRYEQGPLEITRSETGVLDAGMFADYKDACLVLKDEMLLVASGTTLYGTAYKLPGAGVLRLKDDFSAPIAKIAVKNIESYYGYYNSQVGVVLENGEFFIFELVPGEQQGEMTLKQLFHKDLRVDNPAFGKVVDFIVKCGGNGENRSADSPF